jgi:hypothetical protein
MRKYKLLINTIIILQLMVVVLSSSRCKNTSTTIKDQNKPTVHAPGVIDQRVFDSLKKAAYLLKQKQMQSIDSTK